MSKIGIVGHGNVGRHFSKKLSENHEVSIFSRKPEKKENDLKAIDPQDFDFILLTIPDGYVKEVSEIIPESDAIILHTSGSRPLKDLEKHQNRGVLYPLQTFSKEKLVDFDELQLYIEGTEDTEKPILDLAKSISPHIQIMHSKDRATVHLAAVFACNFTNHLYHIAEYQLKEVGMKFQDILPLVKETLEKAIALHPSNSQTGPAVRNDKITIHKHLNELDGNERLIYELITKNIQVYH